MKKLQNEKGFTLVELMIVVAIIGILAAIAIPQFNSYRIRGFNASANSDIKNLFTSQAALFATSQKFGNSVADNGQTFFRIDTVCADGATGPNATLLTGGDKNADGLCTITAQGKGRGGSLSLGNQVSLFSQTDNQPTNDTTSAAAFLGFAKHYNGDTCFAVDSDSSAFYANNDAGKFAPGKALTTTLSDYSIDSNANNQNDLDGKGKWTIQ